MGAVASKPGFAVSDKDTDCDLGGNTVDFTSFIFPARKSGLPVDMPHGIVKIGVFVLGAVKIPSFQSARTDTMLEAAIVLSEESESRDSLAARES